MSAQKLLASRSIPLTKVDNRYCFPVIEKKSSDVQKALQIQMKRYRFAEIWLDYIDDLEPGFMTSLTGLYPHRLVAVFRRMNLETIKMPLDDRWKILTSLSRKQLYVDLDISSQGDDIAQLQNERLALKTIYSYHNYTLTPSDTELRSVTRRMQGWGANIIKVATHCKNQRDALRLLALLIDLREAGKKCIVVGMGKHGVITRVFGNPWGNEMAFAPTATSLKSAAGQIPVEKLDSIMQALG